MEDSKRIDVFEVWAIGAMVDINLESLMQRCETMDEALVAAQEVKTLIAAAPGARVVIRNTFYTVE